MSDELAGLCYNIETLSIDKLEVSTNIWNSKVFGWHIRNALIAIRDHGQINKLCNINIYTLCRIANDTLCVNSHSLSNFLLNNEMGSQIPRLMYALEKKWTQKFLWIGSGFLVGTFWLHKSSIEKAIRSFFFERKSDRFFERNKKPLSIKNKRVKVRLHFWLWYFKWDA